MIFRAESSQPTNKGRLVYSKSDDALIFHSSDGKYGYSSLLINDLELAVDDDNSVMFADGYFPKSNWKFANLTIPESFEGKLYIDCKNYSALENQHVSKRLTEPSGWIVTKDNNSDWICLGNPNSKDRLVIEFCTMHKAVLDHDGNLIAIWLKPEI